MNFKPVLFLIFLVIAVNISFSENTGILNLTYLSNASVTTGLYGTTHSVYCSSNSTCLAGHFCAIDYDGKSVTGYTGWCINSVKCAHRYDSDSDQTPYIYNSTNTLCDGVLKTCNSDGSWSSAACPSGYSCINDTCIEQNTTIIYTTTTGGSSDTSYSIGNSFKVTTTITDFNLTQNQSVLKSIIILNNGTKNIYNLTLAVSGITWYENITSMKYPVFSTSQSIGFDIRFKPGINQTISRYPVTISITTSNSSLYGSINFYITVLPSNQTIQESIIPNLGNFSLDISSIEAQIKYLKDQGADTKDMDSLLSVIKQKINYTQTYISQQDYYNANKMVQDTKIIIDQLKSDISKTKIPEKPDYSLWAVIGIVAAIVLALALYILWPTKEPKVEYEPSENWKKEEKEKIIDKIKNIFKKKKKTQENEKKSKFLFMFRKK